MKMELHKATIHGVEWGDQTTIKDHILYVNKEEAISYARNDDSRIKKITLHLARPGESIRIMPTKDVVEPRCKIGDEGSIFPGIIGEMGQAGIGKTFAIKGAAVVITQMNTPTSICKTGGFIDMSGPAAEFCYFSKTFNLVVNVDVTDEVKFALQKEDMDDACLKAGYRLAVYLAESCKDCEPDEIESYELGETDLELPGVVYVLQLLGQNEVLVDFFLYGEIGGSHMLPTVLHPNELFDGAIVTSIGCFCTAAADKFTTFELQNNPIVEELYSRHGKDLRFLGVIVESEVTTRSGKIRNALFASKSASLLGAKGAIQTTSGHGNPDEDLMLICKFLENMGIKSVIVSSEMGGRDGRSPALASWVPECNAMVSTGNMHELLAIPKKMEQFIGNEESQTLLEVAVDKSPTEKDMIYTEMNLILSSLNQGGFNHLSARWT